MSRHGVLRASLGLGFMYFSEAYWYYQHAHGNETSIPRTEMDFIGFIPANHNAISSLPSSIMTHITTKAGPLLAASVSCITIWPQQQRNMEVFPLLNQKAQVHQREESLPSPIISTSIKRQFPHTASFCHDGIPFLLCFLLDQCLDGRFIG